VRALAGSGRGLASVAWHAHGRDPSADACGPCMVALVDPAVAGIYFPLPRETSEFNSKRTRPCGGRARCKCSPAKAPPALRPAS